MSPVAWAVLAAAGYALYRRAQRARQLRAIAREMARQRRHLALKALVGFLAVGAVVALLSHPKPASGCQSPATAPALSHGTSASAPCQPGR